jgi:hypothetical protein
MARQYIDSLEDCIYGIKSTSVDPSRINKESPVLSTSFYTHTVVYVISLAKNILFMSPQLVNHACKLHMFDLGRQCWHRLQGPEHRVEGFANE